MARRRAYPKRRLLGGGSGFEYDPSAFRRPVLQGLPLGAQHSQAVADQSQGSSVIGQLAAIPGLARGVFDSEADGVENLTKGLEGGLFGGGVKGLLGDGETTEPSYSGLDVIKETHDSPLTTTPQEQFRDREALVDGDSIAPGGRLLSGGEDFGSSAHERIEQAMAAPGGSDMMFKHGRDDVKPGGQPMIDQSRLQDESDVRSHLGTEPTPSQGAPSPQPPSTAPDKKKGRLLSGNIRTSADIYNDIEDTYEVKPKGPMGENREKSFARRLLTGIGSALEAVGPDAGPESILAAIGVGGLGSAFSPRFHAESQNFSRRNQLTGELDRTQQREAHEAKVGKTIADTTDVYSQIQRRQDQTIADQAEQAYKANKEEWDALKFVYQQSDEFNPDDPKNAPIVQRMKNAKFPIFRKKQGDQFDIAPDGRMYNKRTGQVMSGENFAKPGSITMNELPDSLVGLEDDQTLISKAKAKVGKSPEGTQLRPDIATRAPNYFVDGKFDEKKYWADRAADLPGVPSTSDVYANAPSDYDQRLAGEINRLKQGQAGKRAEWDKFRVAITNHSSPSNPESRLSVTEVVELWKIAHKEGKLAKFYEDLRTMQIR